MSVHLVIDGYNLLYQAGNLISQKISLEEQRNKLIELLTSYKKIKRHKITLVFDGTNSPPFLDPILTKGITIKFSKRGELADSLIKKIAKKEKEKAIIVSSDNEIIEYSAMQGASTITSEEFTKKISVTNFEMSLNSFKEQDFDSDEKFWQGHTKKKGSSRKLSKKERKNKIKINKLIIF